MKLYNTLTRKKEEFVPIKENEVTMYCCGPTVYNYIHVGNARPIVVFDTLRRYLIYKGYKVKFVVNFTDIDDKLINRANEEGTTVAELADKYIKEFKEDVGGLNFYDYETIHPRATEHIGEIIDFIQGLIDKNAAYVSKGDVYFNIEAAKDYGKLSKKKIDDLLAGARVDVSELKKNPLDFALWKNKKEGEPYWKAPWGEGRPGWHIECSVMAKTILGDTIDIHAGGEDLQFPHHENEIAQSETLTDKTFARYWLHNSMINVNNEKMSKSLGNFFTVRDISKLYDLEVLRYFLLTSHYRSPLNFTKEVMDACKNSLDRIYNAKYKLEDLLKTAEDREMSKEEEILWQQIEEVEEEFVKAMDDDLNTADGLTAIFNLVKEINVDIDEKSSKELVKRALDLLLTLSNVMGLLHKERESLEDEVLDLIEKRNKARKNKDFATADKIRDQLLEMGIEIKDQRGGTTWRKI